MTDICKIEQRWEQWALALHVGTEGNGVRTLLGPGGETAHTYILNDGAQRADDDYRPALVLTESQARAVLSSLLAHFDGSDDVRLLRKDYDAERGRVDRLTDAVIRLAEPSRGGLGG